MIRLNVRCCCVPVKVLGTLPVFEKDAVSGTRLQFTVMKPRTHHPPPHVRMTTMPPQLEFLVQEVIEEVRYTPEIGDGPVPGGLVGKNDGTIVQQTKELALRHDGITLETLRRIPGFIEASHG